MDTLDKYELQGPALTVCCCCIPLKTGAYILGVFAVLAACLSVLGAVFAFV
jgi:hypothetical protein